MTTIIEKLEHYLEAHSADYSGEKLLLRELAYKRLYDALREVEMPPGEPLSAVWLSKTLGISRTPVREALQQLAADGMLQIVQGRAVTVAARSPQEVYDALHIRELLEPESIRLCASVGMPLTALERLQEVMAIMEAAALKEDRPTWARADHEWHEILCAECPNKLLGQMVLQARQRMYNQRADEHVPRQYLIKGTAEHRQVLDAIMAENGEEAARLMVFHLHQLKENTFRRFMR